jgi:aerobic carbon-monoxide dehydrogenase medium subunit
VKPAPFRYHAPESIGDVTSLLVEHGDEAKVLAGGQSLIPVLALRLTRFDHLIDLNTVTGLSGIERNNGHVRIGATTRQSAVERSAEVARAVPLLAKATPFIGHFQIRNRGTVGGSIAHADPASEYPAVALALDAEMEATGPGGVRTIAARDFFESTWTTTLATDEVLTAVSFPVWTGRTGFAVEEVARRSGDFALVGATASVQLDAGGNVTKAAITMFGVGSTPVRSSEAEAALMTGATSTEVGKVAAAGLNPTDDVHASGAYRKKVAAVVVQRVLDKAMKEAAHG